MNKNWAADVQQTGAEEPKRAFGLIPEGRPSLMLDLRLQSGDRFAVPYSFLINVKLNKSGVIELTYSTHRIIVEGRLLDRVYLELLSHRVRYVLEQGVDWGVEPDEPYIESITIEDTWKEIA